MLSEERLIFHVTSDDEEISSMAVELLKFRRWSKENWPRIEPVMNHPLITDLMERQQKQVS